MGTEGPELFAVVGKPVLHSRSPEMFRETFDIHREDATYIRIAAESKEEAIALAREIGISGFNVTAPFKDIICLMDEVDGDAEKIGAVNVVLMRDGKSKGYNTDTYGAIGPIKVRRISIAGKNCVVLGAGGAARAALVGLLGEGAKVTIANRTIGKAKELAAEFGCEYCSLDSSELSKIMVDYSIVISCVSTAERIIPKELIRPNMTIVEAYYASESALAKDAIGAGATFIYGNEWLSFQGKRSYELFTGEDPGSMIRPRERRKKKNIALVGMMGSGKNAVSEELRRITGMAVTDLDAEIEKTEGKSISDIFGQDGEAWFRELESRKLEEMADRDCILNCGGGIVLSESNRAMLKEKAIVIWLWASPGTIAKRVSGDRSRPLIKTGDEAEIAEMINQRKKDYADSCDMVIGSEGKTPSQIAERIVYEIHKAFPDSGTD